MIKVSHLELMAFEGPPKKRDEKSQKLKMGFK